MRIHFFILFVCHGLSSFSQSGTPDATFGNSGRVIIDLGTNDICNKVISDSAGAIYYAGGRGIYSSSYNYDLFIGKLLSDGSTDNTFGSAGIIFSDFPGYSSSIITDFLLTENYIYALGNGYEFGIPDSQAVFLARYDLTGNLDTTFQNNGYYFPPIPSVYAAAGKIIFSDEGKILFTGNYLDTSYSHLEVCFVTRLLADGTEDISFGGTGTVTWSAVDGIGNLNFHEDGSRHSDGASLNTILQVNDHYLLAGYYYTGEFYMCFMIMINNDGSMHTDFAYNGLLYFDLNPQHNDKIIDAILVNDKIILLADAVNSISDQDFILQMVDTNGLMTGTYYQDFNSGSDIPKDLLTDDFGKILISGFSLTAGSAAPGYDSDYFALAALNQDLTPAGNFSSGGFFTENILGSECGSTTICNSMNNTIISAGYVNGTTPDNFTDIVILRILNGEGNTGTGDITKNSARVYPNPATEKIQILLEDPASEITVSIYDLQGKKVLEQSGNGLLITIPTDHLVTGMYILCTIADNLHYINKLAIK